MIELKDININYGKRIILKDISLKINPGKIIVLTGLSGAGKSTLLGIMSGLLKPTSGKVLFEEKDIFKWRDYKRSKFRKQKLGFIFQFFSLFNHLTAKENILYPLLLNPFRKIDGLNINEIVEFLGIEKILQQYPVTLSGGERQRVAIARAIINNPILLLADEPTGNLDEKTTKDIMKLFIKLKEEKNITIIIATHDKYLIKNSDEHYLIKEGKLEKVKKKSKKKV